MVVVLFVIVDLFLALAKRLVVIDVGSGLVLRRLVVGLELVTNLVWPTGRVLGAASVSSSYSTCITAASCPS